MMEGQLYEAFRDVKYLYPKRKVSYNKYNHSSTAT